MSAAKVPLYVQVLIGVVLGAIVGTLFGKGPIILSLTTGDLGQLGLLVIRLLKALAVPLVMFAILDAFVRTAIPGRAGLRLILIAGMNVSVAFAIGLTLLNTWEPGSRWTGHLQELTSSLQQEGLFAQKKLGEGTQIELSVMKNLDGYVPESLIEPFLKNNIVTVVLLALLLGVAYRRRRVAAQEALTHADADADAEARASVQALEQVGAWIGGVYQVLIGALDLVVHTVPYAVFGVVSMVVGRSGLAAFEILWTFLGVILLGMAIHSLLYYPLIAWVLAKRSPRVLWREGADAILTGLSTNSSLATVPITLKCLKRLGVSETSARLSACVGTNLNNDGITLYEAMTVLFLAQACGFELGFEQQVVVVLASLMAGIGVAGVPEAGLVMLPLVLGAAGLPEAVVATAIPLILPVDWIIARCRSGVNVMSDMLVAILLDAWEKRSPSMPVEPPSV
ncbi:MAG: dicarboxylate/amino acid:cation symporter [Myxococcota bacterium]